MPIEKFKIEVIRTDVYEIEIDDEVWNKEALDEWSSHFWDVEDTEAFAKAIASALMANGLKTFLEGFGHIRQKRHVRNADEVYELKELSQYEKSLQLVTEYTSGISVEVLDHDDDYETNLMQ